MRQYLELKNGIPSHDTIQRAMGMIRTEHLASAEMAGTVKQQRGRTDKKDYLY